MNWPNPVTTLKETTGELATKLPHIENIHLISVKTTMRAVENLTTKMPETESEAVNLDLGIDLGHLEVDPVTILGLVMTKIAARVDPVAIVEDLAVGITIEEITDMAIKITTKCKLVTQPALLRVIHLMAILLTVTHPWATHRWDIHPMACHPAVILTSPILTLIHHLLKSTLIECTSIIMASHHLNPVAALQLHMLKVHHLIHHRVNLNLLAVRLQLIVSVAQVTTDIELFIQI